MITILAVCEKEAFIEANIALNQNIAIKCGLRRQKLCPEVVY